MPVLPSDRNIVYLSIVGMCNMVLGANWHLPNAERPNNLKRRATFEEEEDDQQLESPTSDFKKHRQRSAIDNISLVSVDQAWDVDLKAILPHHQYPCPAIFVLCVVGSLTVHHDLLW